MTNEEIEQLTAAIQTADKIGMLAHVSPDGDAMGSTLGMYHYIRQQYPDKHPFVVLPNRFPGFLAWLPDAEQIIIFEDNAEQAKALIADADLLLLLDHNEPKRLECAAQAVIDSPAKKVLIDHHLNPAEQYADLVISYHKAPSASQMVAEYVYKSKEESRKSKEEGEQLALEAATCLMTGMMTDTGNLEFNANDPETYRLIAWLLEAGVDKEQIYKNIFHQYTENRLRLQGYCLYRKMKIYPKYHTALIYLTKDELKRFYFQSGDAEGIVNMPLQISNIYYSVFMREDLTKIKISFRSEGDRPVNEFANAYFGGGGHKNAAGGESYVSMDDTIKRFEDHFREYFLKD